MHLNTLKTLLKEDWRYKEGLDLYGKHSEFTFASREMKDRPAAYVFIHIEWGEQGMVFFLLHPSLDSKESEASDACIILKKEAKMS